jgi:holo-[acyl-carrier protein] synthase
MVVGLGVDLVELDRVEAALARWGDRLVAKLMDQEEAARLPGAAPERSLALARAIAAKEAASKAIGTGFSRGVRWRDLVLEPDGTAVRLVARALEHARRRGSRGSCRFSSELRGRLLVGEARLVS